MSKERTCLACGKKYNFCPRCEASKNTPWMVTFDCVTCKEIFNVVSGFNMGVSTLADVKAVLEKHNVSDVNVYKNTIKEVLSQANAPIKKESVDIEFKKKEVKSNSSKGISK